MANVGNENYLQHWPLFKSLSKRGEHVLRFSDERKDVYVILISIIWMLYIVFALADFGFYALFLVVVQVYLHIMLGLAENETVNKQMIYKLVIPFTLNFVIGIGGMIYYNQKFGSAQPDFLILGMHPSFFFCVVFYWLGSLATMGVGLYLLRNTWFPKKRWEDFVEMIDKAKEDESYFAYDELNKKEA